MIHHQRIRVGDMLPECSLVARELALAKLAHGENFGAHYVE